MDGFWFPQWWDSHVAAPPQARCIDLWIDWWENRHRWKPGCFKHQSFRFYQQHPSTIFGDRTIHRKQGRAPFRVYILGILFHDGNMGRCHKNWWRFTPTIIFCNRCWTAWNTFEPLIADGKVCDKIRLAWLGSEWPFHTCQRKWTSKIVPPSLPQLEQRNMFHKTGFVPPELFVSMYVSRYTRTHVYACLDVYRIRHYLNQGNAMIQK